MIEGIHRGREPNLSVALCLGVTCLTWGCGGATHEPTTRVAPGKAGAAIEPRADRAPDDAELAVSLQQRLGDGAIHVEVDRGVVTLRGTVDHLLARRHAAEVAAYTRGVVAVNDLLEVRPSERTDQEIQHDLARALALHPIAAARAIDAQVTGGHALVAGTVGSLAERRAAEDVAAGIRGVRAVTCAVEVEPTEQRSDEAIRSDASARLLSDARVDPRGIDVQVAEGRVVLSGVVASEADRQLATRIVSVPGALAVDASALGVRWSPVALRRGTDLPSDDALAIVLRDAVAQELGSPRDAVRVRVSDGVATLEGTVESVIAERAVIELAAHTVGVEQVDDRLTVIPNPLIADEALEERVAELVGMSPYASSAPIDIRVERGVVTLLGDVDSAVARSEVERVATQLAGVRGLDNRLAVDSRSGVDGAIVTARR